MPAPTCTCSVCGQVVPKSQTRHVGDGKRACKVHEGVEDKAQELRAAALKERQREMSKALKKDDSRSTGEYHHRTGESFVSEAQRELLQERCWTCGKLGVPLREWYTIVLLGMKRLELKGTPANMFFDGSFAEKIRTEMGVKPEYEVVLNRVALPSEAKVRGLILDKCAKHKAIDTIAELTNAVQVCPACAKAFGLTFEPSRGEVSFETLAFIGASIDGTLTKLAEESLAAEAEKGVN